MTKEQIAREIMGKDFLQWFSDHPAAKTILGVVISLLFFLIIYLIGSKIIRVVFKEDRKRYDENNQKRIHTLQKVTLTLWRTIMVIWVLMDVLSNFVDVKGLLTVAGVGTVAIGLGAQAVIGDLLAGFFILLENQLCVGDYIEVDGKYGKVERLTLRNTYIRLLNQSLHVIHNSAISPFTNYSKGLVRAIVQVSVAYEADLQKAYGVLTELFIRLHRDYPELYVNIPQIMGADDLGDSAVILRIEGDVQAADKLRAERDLRLKIKEAFDANGIEISYTKVVVIPAKSSEGEPE